MRMMGYMGGDDPKLITRSAKHNDLRLAVELEDENLMLVFCVMQNGAVMLSRTYIAREPGTKQDTEIHLVGQLLRQGETGSMYYMHNLEPETTVEVESELATVYVLPTVEDDDG